MFLHYQGVKKILETPDVITPARVNLISVADPVPGHDYNSFPCLLFHSGHLLHYIIIGIHASKPASIISLMAPCWVMVDFLSSSTMVGVKILILIVICILICVIVSSITMTAVSSPKSRIEIPATCIYIPKDNSHRHWDSANIDSRGEFHVICIFLHSLVRNLYYIHLDQLLVHLGYHLNHVLDHHGHHLN